MLETDTQGKVEFSIIYTDRAGNLGNEVTNITDDSYVIFDKKAMV